MPKNNINYTKETVIKMYEQGYTLNEIGKHFGVSRQSVHQKVSKDERYIQLVKQTYLKPEDVLALNPQNITLRELADYFGLHEIYLGQFLRKHGIPWNKGKNLYPGTRRVLEGLEIFMVGETAWCKFGSGDVEEVERRGKHKSGDDLLAQGYEFLIKKGDISYFIKKQ